MSIDYGLTPELGRNYEEFITYVTDQYMISTGKIYKHSEFKDPNASDYETMDTQWDWSWDDKPPWTFDIEDPATWLPGVGSPEYTGGGDVTVTRCNCKSLSIGGTTGQMSTGQTQSLVALGLNNSLCDPENVSWSLSGGGSFTGFSSAGFSKTYTAPTKNANCDNNATICVSCDDTTSCVDIATNGHTSATDVAYIKYVDTCDGCILPGVAWPGCNKGTTNPAWPFNYGACCTEQYLCSGNLKSAGMGVSSWNVACAPAAAVWCATPHNCAEMGKTEGTFDVRTTTMKAGGCCPKALF